MYSVLHTLSEYTYFCISKNITSYTFLYGFKIVESLQCILKQREVLLSNTDHSNLMLKVSSNETWNKSI